MDQILLYVFYLTFNNMIGASFSDEIIISSCLERGAQLGFQQVWDVTFSFLFFTIRKMYVLIAFGAYIIHFTECFGHI